MWLRVLLFVICVNAVSKDIEHYFHIYYMSLTVDPGKAERETARWQQADPHILWMPFEERCKYADEVITKTCEEQPITEIKELFAEIHKIPLYYKVNCAAIANISLMAKRLDMPWEYDWFIFKQRVLRTLLNPMEPIKHYFLIP